MNLIGTSRGLTEVIPESCHMLGGRVLVPHCPLAMSPIKFQKSWKRHKPFSPHCQYVYFLPTRSDVSSPVMQDGTEALPLLFDVPHMLRDSIKYMIGGCDVMLNEMEQEMGRLHGVMQVAEQWLTLFNGFPQVREQLGEAWDQLVQDDMK